MTIVFSGNRRWCTVQDDRVTKPPENPRRPSRGEKKNEIYTFGYKFTVSAVRRGADDQTLLLYESPLFRTAEMRPAGKVQHGKEPPIIGPGVGAKPFMPGASTKGGLSTLVPVWDEQYRCTTLPERFDFDLEPGTYDVYAAFDIVGPQGGWFHRTTGFVTDVPVEPGRRTRLDGTADMRGISERTLSFENAILLPVESGRGASGP